MSQATRPIKFDEIRKGDTVTSTVVVDDLTSVRTGIADNTGGNGRSWWTQKGTHLGTDQCEWLLVHRPVLPEDLRDDVVEAAMAFGKAPCSDSDGARSALLAATYAYRSTYTREKANA